MFAGLMTLEYQGGSVLASESAGSLTRKRLHRRPGYMRPELPRPQSTSAGEEGSTTCLFNGASGSAGWDCNNDIMVEPTKPLSVIRQQPASDKLTLDQCRHVKTLLSSSPAPSRPREDCFTTRCPSRPQANLQPLCNLKLTPGSGLQPCLTGPGPSSFGDTFSSSFSFIQQSLTSIPGTHTVSDEPGSALEPPPLNQSSPRTLPPRPGFELYVQSPPESVYTCHQTSKTPGGRDLGQPAAVPGQSEPRSAPPSQSELTLGEKLWQERHWKGREETGCCASVTSDLRESLPDSDSCSLDTEAASSLSVDSDAASASSATSGYDSTTPVGDQGQNWDGLVKKYERVLQDCLQNNRTNTKIESMMLKLQRLQQKAILDDDYDTAERFGKKLEELRVERASLKLGLPSRQPAVSLFLQRLRQAVHSALQRTEVNYRDGLEANKAEGADSVQGPQRRRERLLQDKRLVEAEMQELQRQLEELQERRLCLEQQIQLEVQHQETEEVEGMALRSCTAAQLRDMSRTLEDLVTCQNRTQMCVSPPASTLSLQKQERALSVSIKEATAKVVMSQRLGASLRRKVSETETQLLALHEAKLAAISGNDFSSAKELKAEMRTVYVERDRLEGLAKRLHSLSAGNSQELARMKDQQHQLKRELVQSEAQHERSLKENALKYIELLEDKLHSCGCSALECVWEADLEACHLFLRGLQLRTPSYSGPDVEDLPAPVVHPTQQCTKEEEDCAMLTALGGRWCPEANLQNSEFTKKLEEFLFSMEDNHTEDECSEAVDLTEQCELISDRLMTLEDNLQTAILNRDKDLTQSLEKEVREVKATLQTMLAQLKEEEDEEGVEEGEDGAQGEEEEEKDDDIMENENEDEEEEDDQYFSDSWEI